MMKLYVFSVKQEGMNNDYPTEGAAVIAKNEKEAWRLFRSKYNGYWEERLDSVYECSEHPLNQAGCWIIECTN